MRRSPDNIELETALTWPHGTIEALELAFEQGRPRTQIWDLRDVNSPEPFLVAANVYKRGVPARLADGSIVEPKAEVYEPTPRRAIDNDSAMTMVAAAKFVLVDAGFAKFWPRVVQVAPDAVVIALDESTKNLESVATILKSWRRYGSEHEWLVLGGGVLLDTAMFAASQVGAEVTLMPTTFLAMVDAAIGGKTGVNFAPYGKNQVGSFYQAEEILYCVEWLDTLPELEFRCGGAEAIKHALLSGDATMLAMLPEIIAKRDLRALAPFLIPLTEFKEQIVQQDPLEKGCRAWLNFGHTMGHALEAVSHERVGAEHQLKHGEAVAYGMFFESYLSQVSGLMSVQAFGELCAVLTRSQILPTRERLEAALGAALDAENVWSALSHYLATDKKNQSYRIANWSVLTGIGKPFVEHDQFTVAKSLTDIENIWKSFVKLN